MDKKPITNERDDKYRVKKKKEIKKQHKKRKRKIKDTTNACLVFAYSKRSDFIKIRTIRSKRCVSFGQG